MPTTSASPPALTALAALLRQGLPATPAADVARTTLEAFLTERYPKPQTRRAAVRDAYGRSAEATHIPFAGLLPEESPPSGAYGGMSVVWFPRAAAEGGGSLLTFVVGTLGLNPDEGILGRPGHRRYLQAMRTHLHGLGVPAWTKRDPAALHENVPATVRDAFPNWKPVWDRYGAFIYAAADVQADQSLESASATVAAFFDLYARERGWKALAAHATAFNGYISGLTDAFFRSPSESDVANLLLERRFVVLQGPPGTGKTRMAGNLAAGAPFEDRAEVVQFHPAVTYEDFVVGLAPRPDAAGLGFHVRPGWLLQAVEAAERSRGRPFLLTIDEINRGDLGKVLGEAIHLFEPGEAREISLPHPWKGRDRLRLPDNLFVIATMNTADRSIAGMDMAVRRRFAFVTLHPDRGPVERQGIPLATETFDRLASTFVEHAADDVLPLLPGQAYYLADGEEHLRRRFRYELIPLLDEYLTGGMLGAAAAEVQTVRDELADRVEW